MLSLSSIFTQSLSRALPPMYFYGRSNSIVGQNSTADQPLLGAGVALESDTWYRFEGSFNLFKTTGTSNHTFSFGWGGTAGITRIVTDIQIQAGNEGFVTITTARAVYTYTLETASYVAITGGLNTAFRTINFQIRGTVRINTAGTLIPQYRLSAAPGGAYTSVSGNHMLIYPISNNVNSDAVVGNWS